MLMQHADAMHNDTFAACRHTMQCTIKLDHQPACSIEYTDSVTACSVQPCRLLACSVMQHVSSQSCTMHNDHVTPCSKQTPSNPHNESVTPCSMQKCHSLACNFMQHASSGGTWVAAGTIFLDVLVWKVCRQGHSAPPLYRLKGHEGSIHRSGHNCSTLLPHWCCLHACR